MNNSKKFLRTAVGYVRYQARESKNVYDARAQKDAIKSYATENECRLLEVFVDKNKSGKTYDRAGLQALLKYIDANPWKVKLLIVADVTRLSRSSEEFKSIKRFLKDRGVKLISLVHLMPRGSKDNGEQPKQPS